MFPLPIIWRFAAATVCLTAAGLYISEGIDLIRDNRQEQIDAEIKEMSETAIHDRGRSANGGSEGTGFA